jgi:hypothetical protein
MVQRLAHQTLTLGTRVQVPVEPSPFAFFVISLYPSNDVLTIIAAAVDASVAATNHHIKEESSSRS